MKSEENKPKDGEHEANGKSEKKAGTKHSLDDADKEKEEDSTKRTRTDDVADASEAKAARDQNGEEDKASNPTNSTIRKLVDETESPCKVLGLSNPDKASPENILALLINALVSSARISHNIFYNTMRAMIEAGYHDLSTLEKSSWEEGT